MAKNGCIEGKILPRISRMGNPSPLIRAIREIRGSIPLDAAGRALQSRAIVQFQQNFYRKERKERRDKDLWYFFFAIYVFFVVNSSLAASGRAGPSAPFCGKSIEVPIHQPFTSHVGLFPLKANQT
jgi:hypothetical protein